MQQKKQLDKMKILAMGNVGLVRLIGITFLIGTGHTMAF